MNRKLLRNSLSHAFIRHVSCIDFVRCNMFVVKNTSVRTDGCNGNMETDERYVAIVFSINLEEFYK